MSNPSVPRSVREIGFLLPDTTTTYVIEQHGFRITVQALNANLVPQKYDLMMGPKDTLPNPGGQGDRV